MRDAAAILLLATLPSIPAMVRAAVGFGVHVLLLFACLLGLLGALSLSGAHCPFAGGADVCRAVACVSMTIAAFQILTCAAALFCMRAARGASAQRVPLWRLWAWASPRLGRPGATAALLVVTPILWALAQPEASFALGPRATLSRCWLLWRCDTLLSCLAYCAGLPFWIRAGADPWLVAGHLAATVVSLSVAAGATASNRGRVYAWLGQLGMKQSANAAAVVAAVVGGISAKEALVRARQNFCAIPFSALELGDFLGASERLSGGQPSSVTSLAQLRRLRPSLVSSASSCTPQQTSTKTTASVHSAEVAVPRSSTLAPRHSACLTSERTTSHRGELPKESLQARAVQMRLGEVDAFLSHVRTLPCRHHLLP